MSDTSRRHFFDETPDTLAAWMAEADEPAFRARQVFEWVFQHGAGDWEQMTNLSKGLRGRLASRFDLFTSQIIRRANSNDGTVKLLLQWPDEATSECVMIPDGHRRTACIGSQVGCPVGCRFCASGLDGVERNLTRGQIVEQVMRVSQLCRESRPRAQFDDGEVARLSNVVFMGSGEPLANYAQVLAAIHTLNADWGPNIGARKITLSTVGLPKQIRALAAEGLQINLALSLHAPTDALRRELIPWAEQISMQELVDACAYYFKQTGREITFEYILLHEVNDRPSDAEALARVARRLRCNVNLIRYHPVEPLPYVRPTSRASAQFQSILKQAGINVHIRTSRGMDIAAACGQLRRKAAAEAEQPVPLTVRVSDKSVPPPASSADE